MIYIVSGYMRSGTSMMMDALIAGGMKPAWRENRDKMNDRYGDKHYKPNPNGFYELQRSDYIRLDFPKQFEGKLIKCLYGRIPTIAVGNYKIIYMMRDPEEIRQSFEAFFNSSLPRDIENYEELMKEIIERLENRKDVRDLHVFHYRDVVKSPLKYFKILKDAGWPIDVKKCTSVVNPELLRFKREILTVGI